MLLLIAKSNEGVEFGVDVGVGVAVTVTVTGATPPVFAPVPAPVFTPVPLAPGVPSGTMDKPSTPPAAGVATAADPRLVVGD